jgi:hypothetical protein
MARLVVWRKPRPVLEDKILESRKFAPGMVVCVLPDGLHAGSDIEGPKALGWWRVIDVAGPVEDYAHLCEHDVDFLDLRTYASKTEFPRKRLERMDIAALEETTPADRPVAVTRQQLDAAKSAVVPMANPDVVG